MCLCVLFLLILLTVTPRQPLKCARHTKALINENHPSPNLKELRNLCQLFLLEVPDLPQNILTKF